MSSDQNECNVFRLYNKFCLNLQSTKPYILQSQIRGVLFLMSVLLVIQTQAWPAPPSYSSTHIQSNDPASNSETTVEQGVADLTQNPDEDDKMISSQSQLHKNINELVLDNGNGNYSLANGTSKDNRTDTGDLDKSNSFGIGFFGGGPYGGGWGGPWGGGWGGGFGGGPWGGPWGGGYGGFGGYGGYGGFGGFGGLGGFGGGFYG